MSTMELDDVDVTDAAADAGISPSATPETPEPQDLRASLAEAFKEAKERSRDEQGRFTPEQREQQAAASAATAAKVVPGAAAPGASAAAPPGAQSPAVAWKNPASAQRWEQAEWLKTLAPEVRAKALADIARREDEVHVGMTKQDEERAFGRDIQKAVAPYAAMIAAEGTTAAGAVQQMLNTAYVLRNAPIEQKVQALMGVMQNYGIPLERFTEVAGGNGTQVAPEVQQLRTQVEQLNTQIAQLTNADKAKETAQVQAEIAAFQSDPANVHFVAVRDHMSALLLTGRAKDMKDAYDQACWAVPEIRSTLQQAEIAKAEAKRVADEREKVDAARRKATSVRGGPGAHAPTAGQNGSNSSLREQLRSALRDAQGQV